MAWQEPNRDKALLIPAPAPHSSQTLRPGLAPPLSWSLSPGPSSLLSQPCRLPVLTTPTTVATS